MGLMTWGGAHKLGGCIFPYKVLDGHSIKVTTIEELLLGGAKGGCLTESGRLMEVQLCSKTVTIQRHDYFITRKKTFNALPQQLYVVLKLLFILLIIAVLFIINNYWMKFL